MSAAFQTVFAPQADSEADVLGIGGDANDEECFNADDLFSVEVEDESGDLTSMVPHTTRRRSNPAARAPAWCVPCSQSCCAHLGFQAEALRRMVELESTACRCGGVVPMAGGGRGSHLARAP